MAASLIQRQKAADVLRANGTYAQAASAAGVKSVSTIKRWLDDPEFRAMVSSSPEIRPGAPPKVGGRSGAPESQRNARSRMWVAGENQEVLGSYIPPAAFEGPAAVLHVHVVPSDAVGGVASSINAGAYPGSIQGLPVYLDANIPTNLGSSTNEDRIIVIRRPELFIWSDPVGPFFERFDSVGSATLTVRLRLHQYVAQLLERRPKAISVISGTGLATPTF